MTNTGDQIPATATTAQIEKIVAAMPRHASPADRFPTPAASRIRPVASAAQIHVVNAFLLVAIFPFSRLIHIFTVPITYLWRPYQTVVWNRRERRVDEV